MFKRGDIIIIIALIVCAALIYIAPTSGSGGDTLVITVDGKEYRRIDLSDKNYTETIEIDGRAEQRAEHRILGEMRELADEPFGQGDVDMDAV